MLRAIDRAQALEAMEEGREVYAIFLMDPHDKIDMLLKADWFACGQEEKDPISNASEMPQETREGRHDKIPTKSENGGQSTQGSTTEAVKKKPGRKPVDHDKIVRMYREEGKDIETIASIMGVHQMTVKVHLKRGGFDIC